MSLDEIITFNGRSSNNINSPENPMLKEGDVDVGRSSTLVGSQILEVLKFQRDIYIVKCSSNGNRGKVGRVKFNSSVTSGWT